MKRYLVLMLIFSAVVLKVPAQYIVGNPQWKWDTVLLYGSQNELVARYLQVCDVNGNVQEQLVQERVLNAWANKTKITMEYEGGRIVSSTTAAWNGGTWYDAARVTPGYDGLGRITSELIEQNKINGWTNYRLRHYTYGPQNRKLQMMMERWSNGAWLNDAKTDYGYDNNGFYDTITYQFSETGEGWINGMRLIYTCNQYGHWLEALAESWETGTWLGGYKIIYANDARGNILSETYATLTGSAWVNEFRRVFTYDANDNAVTGKNELFIGMQWIPEETTSYFYYKKDFLLMLEEEHFRFEVSYMHFPLGIGENHRKMLTFYPNPADESFRIGGISGNTMPAEVILYNEAGCPVLHIPASASDIINTGNLENGLYIVRTIGNKEEFTGKLLIRHP